MKHLLPLVTLSFFGLACQSGLPILSDSSPSAWTHPLRSDSVACYGFGPYAWNNHVFVQVDSGSVGLRRGSDGLLLWSLTLPPGWLDDVWVLDEVYSTPTALWMFHEQAVLRINPFSGQGQYLSYPLGPNRWTTRMGYVEDETMYIPIYDAHSVSLWRGSFFTPWDSVFGYVFPPNEFGLLDGVCTWGGHGAATLRIWDANNQLGATRLARWDDASQRDFPLVQDMGIGLPILQDDHRLFIPTLSSVFAIEKESDSLLWSYSLPFAWPIPGWLAMNQDLLCLNHEGQGVLLSAQGGQVLQTYSLQNTSWIDRIRPGPLGVYAAWDRGLCQITPYGWRKSHSHSSALAPNVAVLSMGIACRDNRFVYRLGP